MPEAFPFEYRVRAPAGELARHVEAMWYARGTVPYRRERIAPTGSTVAVIVLGAAIGVTADGGSAAELVTRRGFLVGPHDRPVINRPTGETHAVGIVTTPVGCETVFGTAPSTIRGKVVPLAAAWPAAAGLRRLLVTAADPDSRLDAVAETLARRLGPAPPGLERCERAVAMLQEDPVRPVASVAAELGISHAHLDRQLTRVVGLPPRSLARLWRMRRLLESIDVRTDPPWAALAARFGWFDQSHLIRDFKRHTGVTPGEYVRVQRIALAPTGTGDSAGFVPMGSDRTGQS